MITVDSIVHVIPTLKKEYSEGPFEYSKDDIISTTDYIWGIFGPEHRCVFNPKGTDDYYFGFLEFGRRSTNRQTYANRLEFNEDGTIRPINLTMEGVGVLRKEKRMEKLRFSDVYFVRPTAGHAYLLEASTDGKVWEKCGGSEKVKVKSPHTDILNKKYRYLRVKILKGSGNLGMEYLLKLVMRYILVIVYYLSFSSLTFGQRPGGWGNWKIWGDQGDGTYVNPIIPSDYSDIDCIRVGNDYYAISSTFQFSPGMTILHSKDLVNWEICGNAIEDLTQISEELNWTRMNRYGKGVWAGTLRYHNKRFYLFFGTPDEGYFMTSATRPEGPWEPLTCLLSEKGWDDCTVMWDDDSACFVGTHFSDGYKTYLFNMSPDGKSIDRKSAILINSGNGREANKLIKRNKWYYLIFSEYKPGVGRYVMAKRSRKMKGPYKEEKQLALPSREALEPNQGGIILGKDSNWYFLTHHGTGDWSGRIVSLLPVTWIDDWPIIGEVLPQKIGMMKWSGSVPVEEKEKLNIRRSDDFDSSKLSVQWQWNYQPRSEKFSLTERPGWLRLRAFMPLKTDHLLYAGNTLTQRSFRKQDNNVTVKMDIANMADGQKNGLCHFSAQHAAIGIVKEKGSFYLEYRKDDKIIRGITLSSRYIWLKSIWGLRGLSQFYYSLDGDNFIRFGEPYQLAWGNYRGDRLGVYCFNDVMEEGYVDVDYFHYL